MRRLAVVGIEKEVIELARECGFNVVGIFDNKSDVRIFDLLILLT